MLNLKQKVRNFLEKNDYVTCEYRGCFDIVAKREILLLLKVLLNIDSFQNEQAKNLKIVSKNLGAHPFIIGIQTNREKLKSGIVYERFETPTVSLKTFEDLIANSIFPRIYRDKGGLYVEIDSKILREVRKKRGLTQKELAEAVGINKKVIYEHEKKQIRMLLEIAKKIEGVLNRKIIKPINVFKNYEEQGKPKDHTEKGVKIYLEKLGFQTDFVKQTPLDVFAKEKTLVLSDIEINRRKMVKRAVNLKEFIKVVKKPAIIITEKTKEEEVLGIPVIEIKDLRGIDKKEFIKKAKRAI